MPDDTKIQADTRAQANTTALVGAAPSAQSLIGAYRRREASPVEVARAALARVRDCDETLNAMVLVLDELALAQAEQAEDAWRAGEAAPLAGIPITIKDTFDIAGSVTTRGSRIHSRHLAFEDSGAVRRLRAAGAVFIGKTNTAEFGQSATCENRLPQVTRNPWNLGATPGGSSGGAAVSVAAGYVPLALAADGGGSIRIPAAMTGIFGFKPSQGLCSDEGGFRAMSDFACAGPMAHEVADARLFLSVLADSDLARRRTSKGLRIGLCVAPDDHPVDSGIRAAVEKAAAALGALGHQVEEVALDLRGWDEVFNALVLAEEWRERGFMLDYCSDDLSDYALASLRAATHLSVEQVEAARGRHAGYRVHIAGLFEGFDVLLTPTTASPAFTIGERPREIDGRRVGGLWGAFPFTSPFNVGGTPAAAIPCDTIGGLPVSVQLVGRTGQDGLLLDLAQDLEEALAFGERIAALQLPGRTGDG